MGIALILWAEGAGSEVIRPVVAPVLGGPLVAVEVNDLFLPVLFYRVRRWRQARGRGIIPPANGLVAEGEA